MTIIPAGEHATVDQSLWSPDEKLYRGQTNEWHQKMLDECRLDYNSIPYKDGFFNWDAGKKKVQKLIADLGLSTSKKFWSVKIGGKWIREYK